MYMYSTANPQLYCVCVIYIVIGYSSSLYIGIKTDTQHQLVTTGVTRIQVNRYVHVQVYRLSIPTVWRL